MITLIERLNKTLTKVREGYQQYKVKNFGNTILINHSQEMYRFNIVITSFLGILGTAICSLEHEIYIAKGTDNNYTIRQGILIWNMIISGLLVISIIFNYYLWLNIERMQGRLLLIDSMPTFMKVYMAIEIFINIISPYPFTMKYTFNEKIYLSTYFAQKRVDTILLSIMFFWRVYHLARGALVMTDFMSPKAYRIWSIYGNKCGEKFAFKGFFKTNSLILSLFVYLIIWLIYGTLYRFNGQQSKLQYNDLQNFSWANSMWCSFITMTSVGYGDFLSKKWGWKNCRSFLCIIGCIYSIIIYNQFSSDFSFWTNWAIAI